MKKTTLLLSLVFFIKLLTAQQPMVTEPFHYDALPGDEIYAKRIVTVAEIDGKAFALVEIGQTISPSAASNGPAENKKKYAFERGNLIWMKSGLDFWNYYVKVEGRGWLPTDLPTYYDSPRAFYSIAGDISSDAVIWVEATINGDYVTVTPPPYPWTLYKAVSYKYKHGFLNLFTGYGTFLIKYPNVSLTITQKFR